MPSLPTMLTSLGVLLIVHAAYSSLHYRSILEDLDLQDSSYSIPPTDVKIEVLLGFLVVLLSELVGMGSFQSVEANVKEGQPKHRRLEAPSYRTRDFDIYNNRGKLL